MKTLLLRAVVCAFLGLLRNAATPPPSLAAAPPLILVSGPLLPQPIALADWGQNIALVSSGADDPRGQLELPAGRLHFDLALFSGDEWWTYMQTDQPLSALQPEQATLHGRFYPASAHEPALLALPEVQRRGVVTLTSWSVRRMEDTGLAVLAEHGIPIRADTTNEEPVF